MELQIGPQAMLPIRRLATDANRLKNVRIDFGYKGSSDLFGNFLDTLRVGLACFYPLIPFEFWLTLLSTVLFTDVLKSEPMKRSNMRANFFSLLASMALIFGNRIFPTQSLLPFAGDIALAIGLMVTLFPIKFRNLARMIGLSALASSFLYGMQFLEELKFRSIV